MTRISQTGGPGGQVSSKDKTEPETSAKRLEMRLDELRMKWAGTDYEIVLEKVKVMASWKRGW